MDGPRTTQEDREASRTASELAGYLRTPRVRAMKATIAALRARPGIREAWAKDRGLQSGADAELLARWRSSTAIESWLNTVPYLRRNEKLTGLLEDASAYLEEEHERLRSAWALLHASGTWDRLRPSERHLAALLFAIAAYHGPRVPLCHRAAILGIEMMTGRSFKSLATITRARVALVKSGVVAVEPGQAWEAGRKARPTVYDLLPSVVREQLDLASASEGNYACYAAYGHSSLPDYPMLSRAQRQAMERLFRTLERRRKGESEPEQPVVADSGDVTAPTLPWDFSRLIDDALLPAERRSPDDPGQPRAVAGRHTSAEYSNPALARR